MRIKNKKFLGVPIPDRQLSREELQEFSEEDFERLGFETRFWPWYFRACWTFVKVIALLFLVGAALGYGVSFLSGPTYDFVPTAYKFLRLMALALFVPLIVLAVSYSWWYGSIAVEKLRGKTRPK